MLDQLKAQTAPIQPDANGGKSLPDVFKRLDMQDRNIDVLTEAVLKHVGDDRAHYL